MAAVKLWSDPATVTAVGRFRATSLAKEGPVTIARGVPCGSNSSATWCSRRPLPGSKPLQAHATPWLGLSTPRMVLTVSANA